MRKPSILHLPNEKDNEIDSMQVTSRSAFEHLEATGAIASCEHFSYLVEARTAGSVDAAISRLVEIVATKKPDILLWQNVDDFPVTPVHIAALRAANPSMLLAYRDGDPHERMICRFTAEARLLMREADAVFLVGLGIIADLAREAGARRVYYAPHNYENVRFGKPWSPTQARPLNAVMIGNAGRTRVPGRWFPGGRRRKELADRMAKEFGLSFALYGDGWHGNRSRRATLPFKQQEEAMRNAWISVNWDHFDHIPFYFSNRLPVAMAAGVPHITSWHPGYEVCLRDAEGLYWAKTPAEAVEIARYLLSKPPDELIELGSKACLWVQNHLHANIVHGEMIRRCTQIINSRVEVPTPQ